MPCIRSRAVYDGRTYVEREAEEITKVGKHRANRHTLEAATRAARSGEVSPPSAMGRLNGHTSAPATESGKGATPPSVNSGEWEDESGSLGELQEWEEKEYDRYYTRKFGVGWRFSDSRRPSGVRFDPDSTPTSSVVLARDRLDPGEGETNTSAEPYLGGAGGCAEHKSGSAPAPVMMPKGERQLPPSCSKTVKAEVKDEVAELKAELKHEEVRLGPYAPAWHARGGRQASAQPAESQTCVPAGATHPVMLLEDQPTTTSGFPAMISQAWQCMWEVAASYLGLDLPELFGSAMPEIDAEDKVGTVLCYGEDDGHRLQHQLGGRHVLEGVIEPSARTSTQLGQEGAGGHVTQVRMPDPDHPGCFVVLYLPVSYEPRETPGAPSICAPEGQMWRAEAAHNPASPVVTPAVVSRRQQEKKDRQPVQTRVQVVQDTHTLADMAHHSAEIDLDRFQNSSSTQYEVTSMPNSRIMLTAAGMKGYAEVDQVWVDTGARPMVMATSLANKLGLLLRPSRTQLTFADAHQVKGAMELVDGLTLVFNPEKPDVTVRVHVPCFVIDTAGFGLLIGNACLHLVGAFVDPYAGRLYYRPGLHRGDATKVGSIVVRTTTQQPTGVMLCMMLHGAPLSPGQLPSARVRGSARDVLADITNQPWRRSVSPPESPRVREVMPVPRPSPQQEVVPASLPAVVPDPVQQPASASLSDVLPGPQASGPVHRHRRRGRDNGLRQHPDPREQAGRPEQFRQVGESSQETAYMLGGSVVTPPPIMDREAPQPVRRMWLDNVMMDGYDGIQFDNAVFDAPMEAIEIETRVRCHALSHGGESYECVVDVRDAARHVLRRQAFVELPAYACMLHADSMMEPHGDAGTSSNSGDHPWSSQRTTRGAAAVGRGFDARLGSQQTTDSICRLWHNSNNVACQQAHHCGLHPPFPRQA